jgi:hypothetical protein
MKWIISYISIEFWDRLLGNIHTQSTRFVLVKSVNRGMLAMPANVMAAT